MVKQMMCSVLTDGAFHINASSVFYILIPSVQSTPRGRPAEGR